MRTASILACLALAAAGCRSENELRYVSTLDASTQGVALSDDGNDGHVGMAGMTCTISTEWGCPIDDADLPTEDEWVLDHHGGLTLASTVGAVHHIDAAGWRRADDLPIPLVRAARFAHDGMVLLRGSGEDCAVQQGERQTPVPAALCTDGLAVEVDRRDGTLYAAADGGVFAVDVDGAQRIDERADLVAWDRTLRQVYLASTGGTTVRAVKPRGTEIWTADVGGPITALAARGDKGQVLVLAGSGSTNGLGRLHRIDGADGRALGDSELPDSDGEIEVSDNGKTVAIVRPDAIHFFGLVLEREDEEEAPERDPPACLQDDRISSD